MKLDVGVYVMFDDKPTLIRVANEINMCDVISKASYLVNHDKIKSIVLSALLKEDIVWIPGSNIGVTADIEN